MNLLEQNQQALGQHAEQEPKPTVTLTKSAEKQVCRLLQQNGNGNAKLRIYIIGGGCSGFQYGFKLDQHENSDDIILEQSLEVDSQISAAVIKENIDTSNNSNNTTNDSNIKSIKIIIDALSFQYLVGSEIDYVVNLQGARYVVRNPNAETTCGCGSSFSLKD